MIDFWSSCFAKGVIYILRKCFHVLCWICNYLTATRVNLYLIYPQIFVSKERRWIFHMYSFPGVTSLRALAAVCVNSFHTDPMFSRESENVVCSPEFIHFFNIILWQLWIEVEWKMFRSIWSKSTALLGALRAWREPIVRVNIFLNFDIIRKRLQLKLITKICSTGQQVSLVYSGCYDQELSVAILASDQGAYSCSD